MATTTNFGWETPDDTDLVKDGALAMRTLGNAIDASLVDLKGGTTGQVLSKASNTDMDFTWVAQDDSNAIQNAIVDAKGDLIAASAADTPARLAVGNNGETLVADSSTSTGLRYIPYGSNNFAINGAMDFWQRGTSFSIGGFTAAYTADRWSTFNANAVTISQETSIIPEGARYALKITGGATTSGYEVVQALETSDTLRLAGKSVTVSLMVAGTASKTHSITVDSSTSTDNGVWGTWSAISPAGTVVTAASNAYSQLKTTVTVPSTAKSLRIRFTTDSLTSGQVAYISLVQLEIGSTPTPFRRSGGTLAGELAACQRYYYRTTSGAEYDKYGWTMGYTTTNTLGMVQLPVTMRTAPATLDYAGINLYLWGTGGINISAVSLSGESTQNLAVVETSGSTGLTQNRMYQISAQAGTSYLGFSAEL